MSLSKAEMRAHLLDLVVEELLSNPKFIAFYDGHRVRYINKLNARASHIAAGIQLQKDIMTMIEAGGATTPAEAVAMLESGGHG